MTSNFCRKCGEPRDSSNDNFCRNCGQPWQQSMVLATQTDLTSFAPLQRFSQDFVANQEWLREDSILADVQRIKDAIDVRSTMQMASEMQRNQVLAGYQDFIQAQIETLVEKVRLVRRQDEAELALAIKRQDLLAEDEMKQRDHQRSLEILRLSQQHEKEMLELQTTLELSSNILLATNQLRMIPLEAKAQGEADAQQIKTLTQHIKQWYGALTKIDAGYKEHDKRLQKLDISEVEDSKSFELLEQLDQAVMDRIAKGLVRYGERG